MEINPLYTVAGAFVGMLVGVTGVGGGSLMTPLLVLVFGFHPATAVGTDLLYASATKTVGTAVHGWRGTVDWRIVRRLALGSVPATVLTLLLLGRAAHQVDDTERAITLVLGAVLILTAVSMFFRERIVARFAHRLDRVPPRRTAALTVLLGAVLGTLVSLTSVGAGALGMTVLLVLYSRSPVSQLVGSDIAHAVPLTLVAGAGALDAGLDRLRPARLAARRIGAGRHRRQPDREPDFGAGADPGPGPHAGSGRGEAAGLRRLGDALTCINRVSRPAQGRRAPSRVTFNRNPRPLEPWAKPRPGPAPMILHDPAAFLLRRAEEESIRAIRADPSVVADIHRRLSLLYSARALDALTGDQEGWRVREDGVDEGGGTGG